MSFIFKITTTTSPQTFVVPCVNTGTFNATVDYGDGTGSQTVTAYNDSNLTHSFATAGQHTITIDGTFPNVNFFNNAASRVLVNEVVDLGDVGWLTFSFRECANLTEFNGGTADTSSLFSMGAAFFGCNSLTSLDLSGFDTSSVANMGHMLFGCSSLTTLDLSGFDTSSVTNMSLMFYSCNNLTTLDIKHFDVSNVTNGTNFLLNANNALTTTAYDELLEAWAAQDVQPNVPWHFGDAQYTVETIADWYSPRSNSSLSIINNKLVSIADSTTPFGALYRIDNLIVGNAYRFVASTTCSSATANMWIRVSTKTIGFGDEILSIMGKESITVDEIFIATVATVYVGALASGHAANDTLTLDAGITVKEITNYSEANAASEIEYSQENVFGSEEVVNGDFATDSDWVKGDNWSISGGVAVCNSAGALNSRDFIQNDTLEIGKTYILSLDIVSFVSGKLSLWRNSTLLVGNSLGHKTVIFEAGIGNLVLTAIGGFVGSIDNVSVKEFKNAVIYKNIPQSARKSYKLENNIWTGSEIATIEVADFVEPVTSGMTITTSWTVRGDSYSQLGTKTSGSVRVDATISNTDSGILMESGGATAGLILYVYAGVLYFQCGRANEFGTTAERSETSYILPTGEFSYIVEWSANTQNSVLYINGLEVDSQAYSYTLISGSDPGTVGEVNNGVAVNRGGWTANAAGVYSNTITKCDLFVGQVTSDV